MNTMSPASNWSNTSWATDSSGRRTTWSHTASTSARGSGSMEITCVGSPPSEIARRAHSVEIPEPTSRYRRGRAARTNP